MSADASQALNGSSPDHSVNNRDKPTVVVIGAGMTGILVLIKLLKAGIRNVTLLEKADSVGGTWRENTYPGVACDVPSHAYTYSFAPNPDWNNYFAHGSEIQAYFDSVFQSHELANYTRFKQTVSRCIFEGDNSGGLWSITTEQGLHLKADLVFAATGMLHHPLMPAIDGIDDFAGPWFHSARWDHSTDLQGKRIAVIGTGSSASQLIPELINTPGTQVSVFQRNPQWLVRLKDKQFSAQDKQKFRQQPQRMEKIRQMALRVFEISATALTGDKFIDRMMHRLMAWNARRTLKKSIRDPVLRAKLTPDYKMGCKRVVMNDTFYDAIQSDNAELVAEPINHIDSDGITIDGGKKYPVDIIVYATGFNPRAYMRPMEFIGKNGLSIDDYWGNKTQAYRSLTIPNFPNFFLMLGPNSPIGNNSVITISEIQTDYALQLVEHWQQGRLATIEATQQAMDDWNAYLKERMSHTVWTSGCSSWYLDEDGDPLAWPDKWSTWVRSMQTPKLNHFVHYPD